MIISPFRFIADDDASTQSSQTFTASANDSYYPSQGTPYQKRAFGGLRVQTNSEACVYLPNPPKNWRVMSIYISLYNKNTATPESKTLEVFSRPYSIATDSTLTIHKYYYGTPVPLSNTYSSLSTPYMPDNYSYLCVWIGSGSSNTVFTSGYMDIMRI